MTQSLQIINCGGEKSGIRMGLWTKS